VAIVAGMEARANMPSGRRGGRRPLADLALPRVPAAPAREPLPGPEPASATFAAARWLAAAAATWHRAELRGLKHLPDGPALLVGNHGLYGLDSPVFFYLVFRATGRLPIGLAERLLCRAGWMRETLARIGGIEGTPANAHRLLAAGRWVVCYPGGAREVFKGHGGRHRLRWERAAGFARVARDARVPVVPFAGAGIDDTYRVIGRVGLVARLAGHEKYAIPVGVGLGPLPLPARFRFALGAALPPPPPRAGEGEIAAFSGLVRGRVEATLAALEAT
jgi:1-acyl-sn-glycerol-3-phosphate acyltransferase